MARIPTRVQPPTLAAAVAWVAMVGCPTPQPEPAPPPPEREVRPEEPPEPAPEPDVEPAFEARIEALPGELREAMTSVSWREGCPVGLDELAVITLTHWTFEGQVAQGRIIVAAEVAEVVRDGFAAAFEERFPIERMEPVHLYGGDDDRSMAANNTSAFNCRPVAGTERWSEHSYGAAMDVNPVQNPYVRGELVAPPAGRDYLDRSDVRPGMLTADSALVRTLKGRGWGWGGDWRSAKDYQHLSATGR